jgi:hypothetical protein
MSGRLGVVFALVGTAVLVLLGVVSFQQGTAKTRPVVPPFDLFWCEKDEDCIIADQIGCCSCKQGGGQAAITRWRADELRRFLKNACHRKQVCVQVDVCQSTVRARCVDRLCTLAHAHD